MKRLVLCLTLALGTAGPAAAEFAALSKAKTAPVAWSLDRKDYSTVHFDFDRDFLDATAKAKLRQQALFIKKHQGVRFAVTGHTDKVGNQAYNEALGMRRAQRVVAYLVSLGVSSTQLQAMVSFGEDKPVVDSENRERRNRRVTTTVMMPKGVQPRQSGPGGDGRVAGSTPVRTETGPTPVSADTTTTPTPTASPGPGKSNRGRGRVDAGRGNGDEADGDPAGSVGKNRGGDEVG